MAEKYMDLYAVVTDYMDENGRWGWSCKATLEWLDEHPDQVPGRTITESEFKHAARKNQIGDSFGCYEGFLDDIGFTVVPDPEPTNAEKLVEDLAGIYGANLNWAAKVAISEALTERGWTKAPGGDDD